jgi:amino acid transporter
MTDNSTADRDEEQRLARLGYRQELLRSLGGFANFAVAFSVISILTGSITLYGYGLSTAGPLGILIGWIVVSLASVPIALSMAELASAFPTAGALYHWASFLSGKRAGWFTAWFNYLGQFAITAGIDYGLTEFLIPLLGLPSGEGTKFLLYAAVLLSHALINHFGIRWVAFFSQLSAFYHVAGTVVLILVLLLLAPLKPVSFLLTPSTTTSYSYSYAFCLGLLQAQWTFSGYDASAHVSEETHEGSRKVPIGIIMSVVSSGVLGFFMLAAITLAVKDLPAAQRAANPFHFVMQSALGARLGAAMIWMCVIAMWFCGLSSLTSNSRMLYAFARDGGVPFSRQLARVSPRHGSPASAVWVSALLAFALALYGRAYTVVIAMSTVLILISYMLPIWFSLRSQTAGRFLEQDKGPFRLGRYSRPMNIAAVVWIVLITIVFLLPPNQLAFYGTAACCAGLVLLYVLAARYRFVGVSAAAFLGKRADN